MIVMLYSSVVGDDYAVPNSATRVKFDFAQQCKIGAHTFIFEKINLTDVIKELGAGVIQKIGNRDDANLEWVVDYTNGSQLIRFESYGDMGGDAHDLEGIEIRPLSSRERFLNLPSLRQSVAFQFGTIEMSFPDLVAALGEAVQRRGVAWYNYIGKKPIKVLSGNVVDYDVLSTLRVEIIDGKLSVIRLTHVSSS